MTSRKKATWLAYNRRVDIILEPAGQESTQAYPDGTPDATSYGSARRHLLKASKKQSVRKAGSKIPQSLPINEPNYWLPRWHGAYAEVLR